MEFLPLKPIKSILQKYHHGDISVESVVFTRDVLIGITEYFAQEACKEFLERNKRRQLQGLPILKRLDKTSIKTVGERILNQITNKNIEDEVGNRNKILLCRDGATNEEQT